MRKDPEGPERTRNDEDRPESLFWTRQADQEEKQLRSDSAPSFVASSSHKEMRPNNLQSHPSTGLMHVRMWQKEQVLTV